MAEKILRLNEVERVTGLSRSTIYRNVANGTFPEQIKLSARSTGWLSSEIEGWIQQRIEDSRKQMEVRN